MTFVYAVKIGSVPGIYKTWLECVKQINGYQGAIYKKFNNMNEAILFMNSNDNNHIKSKEKNKSDPNNTYSIIKYLISNNDKDNDNDIDTNNQNKKTKLNYDDDFNKNIYIFCDGSAIHKKYKSIRCGYGVFIKLPNKKTIEHSEELISSGTNNLAELSAILYGINNIEKIFNNNCDINPETNIYFVCDSKYAINCILVWSINWKKNNWKTTKGTLVENVELIKQIISKYDELISKGYTIKFKHINSHQIKPEDTESYQYLLWYGNDMADQLARNGKIE
jgi:ribonuclease HI